MPRKPVSRPTTTTLSFGLVATVARERALFKERERETRSRSRRKRWHAPELERSKRQEQPRRQSATRLKTTPRLHHAAVRWEARRCVRGGGEFHRRDERRARHRLPFRLALRRTATAWPEPRHTCRPGAARRASSSWLFKGFRSRVLPFCGSSVPSRRAGGASGHGAFTLFAGGIADAPCLDNSPFHLPTKRPFHSGGTVLGGFEAAYHRPACKKKQVRDSS